MSFAHAILGILGVALLMVIHESGHYFAARRFGMRVTRFSIGLGPTIWKYRAEGSPTTFQVGAFPVLAYVQIAGMNPFEESDPNDRGSYANASLWGRIVTIAAGPLANSLFASVLIFVSLVAWGNTVTDPTSLRVQAKAGGPAAHVGMLEGDRIVRVNGSPVQDWDQLKTFVGAHAGEAIDLEVERGSEQVHLFPVPLGDGPDRGKIMISPVSHVVRVGVGEALSISLKEPPLVVVRLVRGLGRMLVGLDKPELSGPVGIVKDTAAAAREGAEIYLKLLGFLSASLGGFNLLPIPGLDGARLLFLLFEAASRRRADAKVEAKVHGLGILMFLMLLVFVTYSEVIPKH